MRRHLLLAGLAALGLLALVASGPAQADDASCAQPTAVDNYQLLRRLSLDLRGAPPSMSEYDLVKLGADPLAIAAQWGAHWDPQGGAPTPSQEAFRQQMRKYHQVLLWPNISNVRLTNTFASLRTVTYDGGYVGDAGTTFQVSYLTGRVNAYYVNNLEWTNKPFLDNYQTDPTCDPNREQPASAYSSDGYHRPVPQYDTLPDGGKQGWVGYRVVAPYWFPDGGTTRVCAYEAQETPRGAYYKLGDGGFIPFVDHTPDGGGIAANCDSQASANQPYCGCGPNLEYCFGGTVQTDVENDLAEQMMRVIDRSTVGGAPYTDVLLTDTSYVNGRLAFYKKYLPDMNSTLSLTYTENDPVEQVVDPSHFTGAEGQIPDLGNYWDTSWHEVKRSRQHAGVLTLPGYLLRFQTNRSRANRFRIDFLCNYFVPPDQLEDAPPACSANSSDLMRKCNCRLCHATLEPLAAHWGQFSEAGFSLLQEDAGFPQADPACAPYPDGGQKARDARCTRYYVVTSDYDVPADGDGSVGDGQVHHYGGTLKTFLYDDIHSGVISDHIRAGKDDLRKTYIDDPAHEFAHCTVQKVFSYFMRRDMRLVGADNDEAKLLEDLASDFATDYDFSRLVLKIVSLPQYRRVR